MDPTTLRRLRDTGQVLIGADGSEALAVTLQLPIEGAPADRSARRRMLADVAARLEPRLALCGGRTRPGSLCVSAQTIEAEVPVGAFDSLTASLRADGIRIDILETRQLH